MVGGDEPPLGGDPVGDAVESVPVGGSSDDEDTIPLYHAALESPHLGDIVHDAIHPRYEDGRRPGTVVNVDRLTGTRLLGTDRSDRRVRRTRDISATLRLYTLDPEQDCADIADGLVSHATIVLMCFSADLALFQGPDPAKIPLLDDRLRQDGAEPACWVVRKSGEF